MSLRTSYRGVTYIADGRSKTLTGARIGASERALAFVPTLAAIVAGFKEGHCEWIC
jgi:hypothetical protein